MSFLFSFWKGWAAQEGAKRLARRATCRTAHELQLLQRAGFLQAGLGTRALTTDVAVIALVAAVREATATWAGQEGAAVGAGGE